MTTNYIIGMVEAGRLAVDTLCVLTPILAKMGDPAAPVLLNYIDRHDLSADIAVGKRTALVQDDRTLFGDPGFIPASLFWNFGNFHVNASETITVPLGSYDADEDVNGGLNYWTFETAVAGTHLHPEKGFELSAVLGYLYNTENDDTDYQSGQEFHVDYMLNQFLSETFAVGVHGFYYKQSTGDSGGAAVLGDFEGEAAGIGPALMWVTKVRETDVVLSAKWLHELDAEKRLEGDHVFLNAIGLLARAGDSCQLAA